MWKVFWNKGRLCWKIAKLFYFCHLKKLLRPETFGPYCVGKLLDSGLWWNRQNRRTRLFIKYFFYFVQQSIEVHVILSHPLFWNFHRPESNKWDITRRDCLICAAYRIMCTEDTSATPPAASYSFELRRRLRSIGRIMYSKFRKRDIVLL